jgi:hypothetical protein
VFGVNQTRVTELNRDQIVGRQSEYAPRSLGKLLQKSERRIAGLIRGEQISRAAHATCSTLTPSTV